MTHLYLRVSELLLISLKFGHTCPKGVPLLIPATLEEFCHQTEVKRSDKINHKANLHVQVDLVTGHGIIANS